MKALYLGLLMASLMFVPGASEAKSKRAQTSKQNTAVLQKALASVAQMAQTSGPPAKTTDGDQGDDHANAGAILRVCGKETPAARRSAICPVGVSPQ